MKQQGAEVTLTVPVKNTGKRAGTETLQIYIRDTQDAEGPLRSLRSFRRVALKAGEKTDVSLTLTPESFALFNPECNAMQPRKGGVYEVSYGNSSRPEDLKSVTVTLPN